MREKREKQEDGPGLRKTVPYDGPLISQGSVPRGQERQPQLCGSLGAQLFAAREPFAAEFFCHVFVRNCLARLDLGSALGHGLKDVQMIEHVVEAAIIWELVQQGPDCLFRGLQKPSLLRTQYNAWNSSQFALSGSFRQSQRVPNA